MLTFSAHAACPRLAGGGCNTGDFRRGNHVESSSDDGGGGGVDRGRADDRGRQPAGPEGGAGGAGAGAVLAKGNPLLGALLGGALGAGGGYLIGVQMEHADKKDINGANQE